MEFAITGVWHGRPLRATWRDGSLSATIPSFLPTLEELARVERLVALRPGGPYLEADLSTPSVALLLCRRLFDAVEAEEGELPSFEELLQLPDGAIS